MSSGYLYAIGAALTWGVVYAIDQRILRGTSPFALLFVDALITVIILIPILFIDKHSLSTLSSLSVKSWAFIVVSLALAALANYFIFSSIQRVGAAHASIFEIAYPFFVVIFSYFFFNAVPNIYFITGSILMFSGAAIIVFFHG